MEKKDEVKEVNEVNEVKEVKGVTFSKLELVMMGISALVIILYTFGILERSIELRDVETLIRISDPAFYLIVTIFVFIIPILNDESDKNFRKVCITYAMVLIMGSMVIPTAHKFMAYSLSNNYEFTLPEDNHSSYLIENTRVIGKTDIEKNLQEFFKNSLHGYLYKEGIYYIDKDKEKTLEENVTDYFNSLQEPVIVTIETGSYEVSDIELNENKNPNQKLVLNKYLTQNQTYSEGGQLPRMIVKTADETYTVTLWDLEVPIGYSDTYQNLYKSLQE